jgi:hypothetical protein
METEDKVKQVFFNELDRLAVGLNDVGDKTNEMRSSPTLGSDNKFPI